MSVSRRFAGLGIAAGLIVGFAGGAGVVAAQHAGAPAATHAPASSAGAALALPVAPGFGATASVVGTSGGRSTGVAYAQPGVAYPIPAWPGNPGLAPDHTIVVVGVGQASLRSDGSDLAAAERTAIAGAMADAKTQAEAAASAGNLTLQGVVSVSVSTSPWWPGPIPMERAAGGQAPGSQPVSPPIVTEPAQSMLSASVTVAYKLG